MTSDPGKVVQKESQEGLVAKAQAKTQEAEREAAKLENAGAHPQSL